MPRQTEIYWSWRNVDFSMIGERIKDLRIARGLSVRDLAALAKVDKNTVLRVESGKPVTYKVLHRVCECLNTVPPNLTTGPKAGKEKPIRIHRHDDRKWIITFNMKGSKTGLPDFSLVPDQSDRTYFWEQQYVSGVLQSHDCALAGGRLQAAVLEVFMPMHKGASHAGEEYVYCLRGDVKVTIGTEATVLHTGDSVTFDSSLEHNFAPVDVEDGVLPPQILMVWIEGAASDYSPSELN
ncbi:MAG: cupin domain-containing protein [Armatimonadetes bacterium]|nr:cupin domain-containing protein [Armatimonadota bacterium]